MYNLLPDVVSCLSADERVSNQSFRHIIKFLLGFIKKEKQIEQLAEKFLHRLEASPEVQQHRNLAFCLSQFSVNEKMVKRMVEGMKRYKSCLCDEEVYNFMKAIAAKAKKFAKPETKEAVEEWERQLDAAHKGEVRPCNGYVCMPRLGLYQGRLCQTHENEDSGSARPKRTVEEVITTPGKRRSQRKAPAML